MFHLRPRRSGLVRGLLAFALLTTTVVIGVVVHIRV
jgi:hypothetical protein